MSKHTKTTVCTLGLSVGLLVFPIHAAVLPAATQALLQQHQGLKGMVDGDRLVALYGAPIAVETNQTISTDDFVESFVFDDPSVFGFEGLEIHATYDTSYQIRDGKFSVYTYHQEVASAANEDTLPVHGSVLRVLVLHAPNGDRKITYVGMHLVAPPAEDFESDSLTTGSAAITVVSLTDEFDHLNTYSQPIQVVYEDTYGGLHRAWRFFGADEDEEYQFFVDAASEEILSAESSVFNADVSGTVIGATTANPLAEEIDQNLAGVRIGLYEPVGPLSSCGVGDLFDELFAEEDGQFSFQDVTFPVRVRAVLESDAVTVLRTQFPNFYAVESCEDVSAATTNRNSSVVCRGCVG